MRHSLRSLPIAAFALLLLAPIPLAATSAGEASEPAVQESRPAPRSLDPTVFPVPHELRPNVEFWLQVYTRYDNDVVLLHDEWHLGVIYAALDFGEVNDSGISDARKRRIRRQRIEEARTKYKTILRLLAAGKVSDRWPQDQERVEQLFDAVPGDRKKYTRAQRRLRTQTCLRNRFAEAIERSGYFMPTMERIFRDHGLPTELTRLPFVESLFQWRARSSAAAGGIWQFMPSTARFYMDMTAEIDERFDPLTATDAAARHLSANFEALDSWPLAITAYNHGRAGMKRAVR
ncbi:MAG: lytic transglycosylase domain-containing protein, partial [Acidobacteriota bacterium]